MWSEDNNEDDDCDESNVSDERWQDTDVYKENADDNDKENILMIDA